MSETAGGSMWNEFSVSAVRACTPAEWLPDPPDPGSHFKGFYTDQRRSCLILRARFILGIDLLFGGFSLIMMAIAAHNNIRPTSS